MGTKHFKKEKSIYLKEAKKLDIFFAKIKLYNYIYGKIYYSSYKKNNNKMI